MSRAHGSGSGPWFGLGGPMQRLQQQQQTGAFERLMRPSCLFRPPEPLESQSIVSKPPYTTSSSSHAISKAGKSSERGGPRHAKSKARRRLASRQAVAEEQEAFLSSPNSFFHSTDSNRGHLCGCQAFAVLCVGASIRVLTRTEPSSSGPSNASESDAAAFFGVHAKTPRLRT
jgi:hypothetical protein